ncbi:unnamed protein product [Staurois parvus]|uniref:Uncharacterized protein n=1 Tax=Staurois parvus TaxID=386267 RepID=A0ABN9FFP1_9NEOB|nr:unnamed protein product [Staurois parvus]
METHSMKLSTHWCCAKLRPHEVWRSLATASVDSWRLLRTVRFSMPHSVILHGIPLCG